MLPVFYPEACLNTAEIHQFPPYLSVNVAAFVPVQSDKR